MDILLDPRNKLVEEFFIFLKIQDGRWRSKIEFRHNFGSKFTFRLGKWIPFIRFGQNLAGRYYSTLGTSLRNNFWPIAKSKMAAAAAITAKYEIGHSLKSIQVREPIFFPRPMFSRVRNAMKLSFAFYDPSNYLKIQNGRHFWDFTLIREALYFCGSYKLTGQFHTSYPFWPKKWGKNPKI